MKNIFQRFFPKEEPQVAVATKQYPKEVLEIHHAFETAGENLLAEAKGILAECEGKSIEKGKRLLNLGFKQSREAVIAVETITKEANAKEIADLVCYYHHNYPNNKFITEKQVKAICEKWGLVCGDTDRYKGFVPEKNLKDIENFSLRGKEKGTVVGSNIRPYFSNNRPMPETLSFPNAEIERSGSYYLLKPKGASSHAYQSDNGIDFYACDSRDYFGYSHLGDIRFTLDTKMKICAPLKEMDITGMELRGYKLQRHIPDPVVLQPVRGGYLIVTKWADEMFDPNDEPMLINEKMN